MKTPYTNIYKVLRTNRFVVLTVVIGASLSMIASGFFAYRIFKQSQQSAFVINDQGQVIPLQLIEHRENLEVEAKAHLEMFHRYFYQINANNFERNMEKALWLGDNSIAELYRQKKAEGIYNRLLQYSLIQKISAIHSEISLKNGEINFMTTTRFSITRGEAIDSYEIKTSGQLMKVDRNFPHNPHGLIIKNFYEQSLTKIHSHESTKE